MLLVTLEFMLLFVGQSTDGSQRECAGLIIVCIVCLNFALNLLPMARLLKRTLFGMVTKCKERRAQKLIKKYLLRRSGEEKFYDTKLKLRVM